MATTNTYLTFDGNCEEAFNFYKSVFGGEFVYLVRFDSIPDSPEYVTSVEDKHKIMHVSLPIGQSILMGSDITSSTPMQLVMGNNFSISISADSKEEADTLFAKISAGGIVTMPIADAFWGDYFGMAIDKYGIQWMVNFNTEGQ
ncbi:VOC family protein [Myroides marinus]|uniref:VOC family protein n=1 Tax=Myroides marinus TaxID=703342 RepID=UPI0025787FBE|nr:VOC family protein [Myroides marinus]MDM1368805.1 VOC family protein [Myroides marinus]MDM1371098.1 VOC family protein [Myroides marinus]MDM1374122.1 VOC family protein [Myroides marinus]MDM1382612.1 VOC family protein [Myroides marinus]MDM1388595.1 VOC family protein [Myroides marinus]